MTKYDAIVFQILEKLKPGKEREEKEGFDAEKADLDGDGKVSEYEEKRGKAIQKAIASKDKK